MRDRRRRVRGRIVTAPSGGVRAWIGPDGSISLPSGYTYRLGVPSPGRERRVTPGGRPPAVRWRESRERMAVTSTVFASPKGVFLKLEVENPFREARPVSIEATVDGLDTRSALEVAPDGLVSSGDKRPFRLLDVAGAKVSPGCGRRGGVTIELVLPPRGKRTVECVLEPQGRTRARSLGKAYAEAIASWDALRDSLAVCRLPDETLAAAFDRAWYALLGSISGGESQAWSGQRRRPDDAAWPRPGLRPQAGPATLDALALRALDRWGAGRLVEDCLRWVLETQGTAAPPGDSFSSARGFLSLPPEEKVRDRWGSDCGALLWATCERTDVGVMKGFLRSVRREVEDACAWIVGELGRDGLMPTSRGPGMLGRDAEAWNDAWSWRGLDAAARMLEGLGRPEAARLRALAESYRDAIVRAYSGSRAGRQCLERLRVALAPEDEKLDTLRLRSLYVWADDLASAALTAEGELRTAVFFLDTLRRLLVREEGATAARGAALSIFPGVPPTWLGEHCRLELERMPTSAGPLTVRVASAPGGRRLVVEAELPKGAPETALHLGRRRLGEVRVNGRRSKRAKRRRSADDGLVWLPKGGGHFDVSAEIAGGSPPRKPRRRKPRPK